MLIQTSHQLVTNQHSTSVRPPLPFEVKPQVGMLPRLATPSITALTVEIDGEPGIDLEELRSAGRA